MRRCRRTPVRIDERLVRFARAHLRSPAQRAVYTALAGAPTVPTTGTVIAERFHLEAHQVDVVLRQFEAAGIVEAAGRSPDGERLYRWQADMAYLYADNDDPVAAFVDPVCGMPVPIDSPHHDDGQWFCSLRCQTAWRVAARSAG